MNIKSPIFLSGLVISCSMMNMSFDLRLSPLLLLPLFLLSVAPLPRIFTISLLALGLCEDVFFGRLLGITPLFLLLFQILYQVGFQVLFKLENFYLLWGGFFLSTLLFQGVMYLQYTAIYEYFHPSSKLFVINLLTVAAFPFLLRKITDKKNVRYGS